MAANPTTPDYPDPTQSGGTATPPPVTDPTQQPAQPAAKPSTRDQILALYQKYGVSPGGAGSGFTDTDYWTQAADKTGGWGDYWDTRLGGDLAGTGPDRPAGQPQGNVGTTAGGSLSLMQSNWQPDPRAAALYDTLSQRSAQALNPQPDNRIINDQVDAYAAQQTRAQRNYLQGLAESAGPSANIGAERRAGAENIGSSVANFQAQLVSRELQSQRDQIQAALTQQGAMLSDEEKMQLQQQLALMDNALGQAGLQQQGTQFGQTLGQNAYQFDVNDEYRRSPIAGGV